jgi:hypothetical protein
MLRLFKGIALAAFGESCRRCGHVLTARFDPKRRFGAASCCIARSSASTLGWRFRRAFSMRVHPYICLHCRSDIGWQNDSPCWLLARRTRRLAGRVGPFSGEFLDDGNEPWRPRLIARAGNRNVLAFVRIVRWLQSCLEPAEAKSHGRPPFQSVLGFRAVANVR